MGAMKDTFAYAFALLSVIVAFPHPRLPITQISRSRGRADPLRVHGELQQAGCGRYRCDVRYRRHHRQSVGVPHGYREVLRGGFKAGNDHIEIKVDQVWPLGPTRRSGGHVPGHWQEPEWSSIEIAGHWTATYVREGGKLKIRMPSRAAAAAREIKPIWTRVDQHSAGAASGCYQLRSTKAASPDSPPRQVRRTTTGAPARHVLRGRPLAVLRPPLPWRAQSWAYRPRRFGVGLLVKRKR